MDTSDTVKILLAKGHIYEQVVELLADAGIALRVPERTYFPISDQRDLKFQIVKPQVASVLLAAGKADAAFSGRDWVRENGVEDEVEEVLDLGLDPVRIVAAVPESAGADALASLAGKDITVATEYEHIAREWLARKGLAGRIFSTWGTSEGFVQDAPDSPAQVLIDNTSTGSSLKANRLKIVDVIMESSTRFYASRSTRHRDRILGLATLFKAVLDARRVVLLEMNVSNEDFERLISVIPSMKSPTVSPLFGGTGYAVKVAVAKRDVPALIPVLKSHGAQDILEYGLRKVVL